YRSRPEAAGTMPPMASGPQTPAGRRGSCCATCVPMDGIHDLGGMEGFGPVVVERDEPVFHAAWERTVFGLATAVAAARIANTHEHRHAIERMDPAHYLTASYYERWLTALGTLLVEKGVVTVDELARGGPHFPLSRPAALALAETRGARAAGARFAVGDLVRVRPSHPVGHP